MLFALQGTGNRLGHAVHPEFDLVTFKVLDALDETLFTNIAPLFSTRPVEIYGYPPRAGS